MAFGNTRAAFELFSESVKNGNGRIKSLKDTISAATVGVNWWAVGIGAAITAISLINAGIKKYKENLREAAQESARQAEESAKAVESLTELKTQLENGSKSTDDLTTAFKEQLKQMGYTEAGIDNLIKKYGGLEEAIKGTTEEVLAKNQADARAAKDDAKKSALTELGELVEGFTYEGGFIRLAFSVDNWIPEDIEQYSKEIQDEFRKFYDLGENADSTQNIDDLLAYYNQAQKVLDLLKNAAIDDEDIYNESAYLQTKSAVDKLSASMDGYANAITRVHEADAQIELSNFLKTNDIATKEDFDAYIKGVEDGTIGMVDGKEASDAYKQVLIDVANDAFPQFSNAAKDAGENANEMTDLLDNLKDASDSIATLQKAFDEMSEDGYITTETLSKIKEAVGDNIDNWDEYKQKLLTVKAGSAEFKQILSDLTYAIIENKFETIGLENATKEEVAAILRENGVLNANEVAHHMIAKAKVAATAKAFDFADSFDTVIEGLEDEIETLGLTQSAIGSLEVAYGEAQRLMTELTKEGVLDRLGLYSDELKGIRNVSDVWNKLLPDYDSSDELADAIYKANTEEGKKLFAYAEAVSKIDEAISNIENLRVTYRYSSSKSSSDKDKPDKADPTDAIINRIASNVEALQKQGEIIDHQLDMIDVEDDYEKAVELTNKALDNRLKTIEASRIAQNELSKEAQRVRDKYKGIDVDSFFDADGDFTEAYNKYYDSFTSKAAQEAFADDMKMIQAFKKAWFEYHDEIMSLEKEVFDMRKDLQDMHYDHLSNLIDQLERHAELQEKQSEQEKEYYDYLIEKTQALLDIKKAQFDLENKLLSAQREAEKALATSKIGSEYLDEETRNLVYNDDDYELEMDKIKEISDYVEGLTEDYISDINSLGEDEIYKAEEITAQYERRLALKEKELEIVQAEVDLQKKQDALNNVLAEQSVRQIVNGKWEWTHDTDKLRQATEDLADAKAQVEQLEREQEQLKYTNSLEARIGKWELEQETIDMAMEHLQDKIDEFSVKVELFKDPLEDFAAIVSELTAELGSFNIGYYSGSSSSGSSSSAGKSSSGRIGSVDPNANVASVVQQMMNNSTKWHVSDSSTKEKLHAENQKLASSIGADYNPPDGKYYQNGKPLYDSGGVLKGIGGIKATTKDEIVLPPDLTDKILTPEKNALFDKFTNNLDVLLNPDLMPIKQIPFNIPQPNLSLLDTVTNRNTTVNYNVYGGINISEVNDGKQILSEITKQVRSMPIPN